MNYITESVAKDAQILWQSNDDNGLENPILIEPFNGSLCMTQENNIINIQYSAIKDLIKILKSVKEPH